jgi:tetratricopeptide (TPR) repeat protein
VTFRNGDRTRLDSWKAVSLYFGRDERTVRRWEAERGLPIHRLPGAKRSQVYAEISELDSWLTGAGLAQDESRVPEAAPARLRGARQPLRPARDQPPASVDGYCAEGERGWAQRTPSGLNHALDAFNAAARLDPTCAAAFVGLAKTYILLREFTLMPDAQAYPMARSAARRALALDDTLAMAHAASAFVDFWSFWDAPAAELSFSRAIGLDPDSVTIRHWHATFLSAQADHSAALREIDRALTLDPASLPIRADRGLMLVFAGRQPEGVALLREVTALDPGFRPSQRYLAAIYLVTGMDRDYLRQAASLAAATPGDRSDAVALDAARVGYDVAGRRGMLAALLADRLERARVGTATAYSVAKLYAMSRNESAALTWLQKSLDRRETEYVEIVCDPAFASLRRTDAFQALVAALKPMA